MRAMRRIAWLIAAASISAAIAQAPGGAPVPVPSDTRIPVSQDRPYPGTMTIAVDATDTRRGILRVHQMIPVAAAGPLTLLHPKWLPGTHGPEGVIAAVAGLTITAAGQTLDWVRDDGDVSAFTVDVPAGVSRIEVDFQFLTPTMPDQGRVVMTPDLLDLQWIAASLYPAGYFTRDIPVVASAKFPAGFQAATALEVASSSGDAVTYKPVSYDVLVDSPVYAGRYVRREELCPNVYLNVFGDRAQDIDIGADQLQSHRRICAQAVKLFGSRHYDHYDFLLSVSDRIGRAGLEHHRSSENSVGRKYFKDWTSGLRDHDTLAHEFVHSWNGKYRRPADLWTPDFRTPMQGTLLWVYEGQTQFWGHVLSARSGMLSKQDVLDELASDAAQIDNAAGRQWRTVEDTTNDPIVALRRPPKPWPSWQRSEDYYVEGSLTWLDANALIAEMSGGKKSMNDFARAFFGVNDRDYGELTYRFDDVVAALNQIVPYDWATFLKERVYSLQPHAPLAWIGKGGYRLDYTVDRTAWIKSNEKARKIVDLAYSLGLTIGEDGEVASVLWDGPAFDAGLTIGTTIVAIDGRPYGEDEIREGVAEAAENKVPIKLLIKQSGSYRTVDIPYFGGLRYPHLVKVTKGNGSLDRLLAPIH